jgi:hypothetical protein
MMFPTEARDIDWPAPGARDAAKAVFEGWIAAHDAAVERAAAVKALREAATAMEDTPGTVGRETVLWEARQLRHLADRIEKEGS